MSGAADRLWSHWSKSNAEVDAEMTRVSEEALETALNQLSEHVRRTADSNWTQAFLAGRRIAAAPYDSSTRGADRAVADLFTLVPNVRTGTLNPFINLNSTQRWLKNEQAGRSTVWNKATRGYTQTLLFNDDGAGGDRHIGNGIRADAIEVLLEQFRALDITAPAGAALAVLITRDRDWGVEPTTDELRAAAAAELGLTLDEYKRFTVPTPLGCLSLVTKSGRRRFSSLAAWTTVRRAAGHRGSPGAWLRRSSGRTDHIADRGVQEIRNGLWDHCE